MILRHMVHSSNVVRLRASANRQIMVNDKGGLPNDSESRLLE